MPDPGAAKLKSMGGKGKQTETMDRGTEAGGLSKRYRAGMLALVFGAVALPAAADWPQIRGPRGAGHSRATGLPQTWSELENVAWKVPLPGLGHSSPVIFGDSLWLTTALAEERSLRALGLDVTTGEIRHDVEVFRPAAWQASHPENSYASPTPVIEEGRVYVHFGAYGTACLDTADGKVVWRRDDLVIDHEVGPGSSPILFEDLLVVNFDGTDQQFVAAFYKASGELAWRAERTFAEGNKGPHRKAFSTPIVVYHRGRPQLVTAGADQVTALEPRTGERIWEVRFEGYSVVPLPSVGLGRVFVDTGYVKPHLFSIRLGGRGDVTETHVDWRYHWQVPANPSPLLVGDRIFLMEDWGIATWLDARRGEHLWRRRLGGRHWASPIHAHGRIYTWSAEGETLVLAAADEFRELARNRLDGTIHATPAVHGHAFYVRTTTHLYRLEEPGSRD